MAFTKSIAVFLLLSMLAGCAGTGKEPLSQKSERQASFVDLGSVICQQTNNGLMWQIKKSPQYSTWQEAKKYAEALDLGGHTDWRLPTRDELYMLHYISSLQRDSNCMMKLAGSYWSGTTGEQAKAGKWEYYTI